MILQGALATGSGRAIVQMRALAEQIRGEVWRRWYGLAQRRALLWWKLRRVAPGVAARFTNDGARYYGYGNRLRKPSSLLPYYKVNNGLELLILNANRKPKTKRTGGGPVETVLAFGGGSLNFMTRDNYRPVIGWTRTTRVLHESFNVGSYTRATKSGSVQVQAYSMSRWRTVNKSSPRRGGPTHAEAFGNMLRDRPALEARVAIEMRRIIQRSAIDKRTGKIKTSVLAGEERETA
jgi:hypothetical protein